MFCCLIVFKIRSLDTLMTYVLIFCNYYFAYVEFLKIVIKTNDITSPNCVFAFLRIWNCPCPQWKLKALTCPKRAFILFFHFCLDTALKMASFLPPAASKYFNVNQHFWSKASLMTLFVYIMWILTWYVCTLNFCLCFSVYCPVSYLCIA